MAYHGPRRCDNRSEQGEMSPFKGLEFGRPGFRGPAEMKCDEKA
jgi:hypothetical protein